MLHSDKLNAKQDYVYIATSLDFMSETSEGALGKISLTENKIAESIMMSGSEIKSVTKSPDNKCIFVGDKMGKFSAFKKNKKQL